VDETIRLRTGIRERLFSFTRPVQEALIRPHLHMMLVTKRAKFLARLGSRHRPSFRTLPYVLQSKTVCQWNTLVRPNFGNVPQFAFSYASGVQVSRVYSPEYFGVGLYGLKCGNHLEVDLTKNDELVLGL
jgi:hypothetical protein